MTEHGILLLQLASKAWPEWFDRLCHRLPGVRLGALYGKMAVKPIRRPHESWEQAYQRLCIDEAPKWIAERAVAYREYRLKSHAGHSNEPIYEIAACPTCPFGLVSWIRMTHDMYFGDPFLLSTSCEAIGYIEPEFFRSGAGTWGGRPTLG